MALFPGLPRWDGTSKVKPIWILVKQETVSGSGISCAICKSAPCPRQTTTPATYHSVFFTGRTPFLPPNQQHQSTEGKTLYCCYYYYFKEWTWTTGRRKPRGNWLTDVYLKKSHHNRATRKVNLVESFCSMLVVEVVVPLVGIECIFIAVLAMACVSWMYGWFRHTW